MVTNSGYILKAPAMCQTLYERLSVHYLILSSYNEVVIFHILHMTKLRLSNLFKVTQFLNVLAGVALKFM